MKDIIGYEGLYKIDRNGNVYSIPRKGTKGGILPLIKEEYYEVALCKNMKVKRYSLHRLLAIHFIDNPQKLPMVNHKNGNKYDNSLSNLEWCNNSINIKHAYDNGLIIPKTGSSNGNSKLTEAQVKEIRSIAKSKGRYYGRKELSLFYGVSECTIKEIVSRRKNNWKNVH